MIEIDGSYLEGGGQIVRTALALSVLTGRPFKIKDIRKNRPNPGLKNQHLFSLRALKELCNAETFGDEIGSDYFEFIPKKLEYHHLNIDIGTAGSITLVLQALLPVMLFSDKSAVIKIAGGTDTMHSMPIDYFINIFLPHMKKYADFEPELLSRGYYSKGQGRFVLKIKPKYSLPGFRDFDEFLEFVRSENKKIIIEEQGKLMIIKGISHASKELLQANVAERQAKTARFLLCKYGNVKIDSHNSETQSVGSGITLWALFSKGPELDFHNPVILGADCLGEKRKKAEKVGEDAAKRLEKEINSGAAVDSHLADQLLLFMAIFGGSIKTSEITDHTKTNIYVIEKFMDVKFEIKEKTVNALF